MLAEDRGQSAPPSELNPPDVHSFPKYSLLSFQLRSSFVRLLLLVTLVICCSQSGRVFAQATRGVDIAANKNAIATPDQNPVENLPELKIGVVIEGRLKGGDSDRYRVSLHAGEYLKVSLETRTIGLLLHALDANSKTIAEITVAAAAGSQSLWASAETSGTYQIRITAPEKQDPFGEYRLKLETLADLKAASPAEQAYVKGDRLVWEAEQLRDRPGPEALGQSIANYREALGLWRRLGDRFREAYALFSLGYVYGQAADDENSTSNYLQALALWRDLRTQPGYQSDTLYNLGSTYAFHGKVAEAIACYKEAIDLRRSIHALAAVAYALTNLGQVYINVGEFQAALDADQESLQIRKKLGDVGAEARSLSNVAGVYYRMGEIQQSLEYSLQALTLRRAAGDRRGEAITLANIGSAYRELGEPKQALGYYEQALSILRSIPTRGDDPFTRASILDGIGRSYYDLGDYPKALENFRAGLSLRGVEPYGKATSLTSLGNVYARMGEQQKALESFDESLKLARSIGDRRSETLTLQREGEIYAQSGQSAKARDYFDQGLALSRAIKNRACEATLLYDIAVLEARSGRPADARSHVEGAIAIIESARSAVASSDLRASFLASKQDFYELDIDLLMQSFRRDRDQAALIQAFAVNEQRRARGLLETLRSERATIHAGAPADLLARERELRSRLNQKAESQVKLLSGNHTAEQAAAVADEVDRITQEYEQVLARIRVADPHYAGLTQSASVSVRELQTEILDSDVVLLEYALGQDRSYLWAITPSEVTAYELPARSEIETQTRNIYDLLTARDRFVKFEKADERQARIASADAEYLQASTRLSQTLLGPVAAKINGKRLLIVSDGALQYLPFSALPSPLVNAASNKEETSDTYRPLIVDHEVTSVPSASVLAELRRELLQRKPAPKAVAVLADPVFSRTDPRVVPAKSAHATGSPTQRSGDLDPTADTALVRAVRDVGQGPLKIDRLPSTRREAEAIFDLVPKADQFAALDFAANRAAATNADLGQYRIVHFATHGLINPTHPGLSGLILSLVDGQGNDQNGFVTTQEVFNLRLPAELVVLSGCRTGLGKEIKGEGMLGLTRGFLYAGAARLAVSLWDVNDESSAALMARFYKGMLGKKHLTPSAALRDAQVSMWKSGRWHAPYYWGAFILQGEYR